MLELSSHATNIHMHTNTHKHAALKQHHQHQFALLPPHHRPHKPLALKRETFYLYSYRFSNGQHGIVSGTRIRALAQ